MRPKIAVYEAVTARGIGRRPDAPDHSLYREGLAMRTALAADVAEFADVVIVSEPDAPADFSFLIAPESGGELLDAVEWCRRAGGTPIASESAAIQLTSDKLALADHWRQAGVPTPLTSLATDWLFGDRAVVRKPRDGAGSQDTHLHRKRPPSRDDDARFVLTEYRPGQAVSVTVLCGKHQSIPLPACTQILTDDGQFQYLGGEVPLNGKAGLRAANLAVRAVQCVPGLLGWIGVDIVLGAADDGSDDVAIEINPRLTTSYVGLRALSQQNLAAVVFDLFRGGRPDKLLWKSTAVRFQADGAIVWLGIEPD